MHKENTQVPCFNIFGGILNYNILIVTYIEVVHMIRFREQGLF